jgi:ketosteroid isomerase-like protein
MKSPVQRTVVGVCASSWLLACSPSSRSTAVPAVSPQARQSIEAAIRDTAQSYGKAIVVRDTDAILGFYTADTWLFPPDANVASTADQRRTYWSSQSLPSGVSDTVGVTGHVEIAQSGELAVEYGRFFQVTTDSKGTSKSVPRKYMTTWARQSDGSWKVIADMWNTGG